MTGTSAATGGVDWTAVNDDAYGVQSTNTSNLSGGVYRLCHRSRGVVQQSGPENLQYHIDSNKYAATMRWCATAALNPTTNPGCRATWDSSRMYPRMPAPRIATITVSASSSAVVSGLTVDGLQIMNAATASSSTNSTVADRIRDAINACSNASRAAATAQTVGYSATSSGSTVTIYAPGVPINATPVADQKPARHSPSAPSPKATSPCRTGVIRV